MDITIARIIEEMKYQNKKHADLASYIGVTPNVITDWKSGRIKSYKKYIHGIAEFLNVSVEYVRGEIDNKQKNSANNDGEILKYKVAAMGGMSGQDMVTIDKTKIDKWTELIEATRDLSPEKIDMLIKMAESIK